MSTEQLPAKALHLRQVGSRLSCAIGSGQLVETFCVYEMLCIFLETSVISDYLILFMFATEVYLWNSMFLSLIKNIRVEGIASSHGRSIHGWSWWRWRGVW